jgi:hypothetical protein
MNGTKSWIASQAVWGGIAAIGAGLAGAYVAYKSGDMQGVSAGLLAAFGGVQAIIGRIKADTVIGAKPVA